MSIYKKLFEAKQEIGKISKDSTNPFYKSKYFDINQLLEHVEPILAKHNLLLLQPIEENIVYSRITSIDDIDLKDVDSLYHIESGLELTNQTDPQKRGSEITYYRRYTLASLLGLQAEDDDANKTVQKQTVQDVEKVWLNKFTDKSNTELTRDWKRAVATLKEGKDMWYLRNRFKISKAAEELLLEDVK